MYVCIYLYDTRTHANTEGKGEGERKRKRKRARRQLPQPQRQGASAELMHLWLRPVAEVGGGGGGGGQSSSPGLVMPGKRQMRAARRLHGERNKKMLDHRVTQAVVAAGLCMYIYAYIAACLRAVHATQQGKRLSGRMFSKKMRL